ncbi:MAG: hypothetical protein IJY74_05705, partial [Oscillospiraceae bacterium]|nr:hypothetical protein [Oscillospiraceae bacterium]
LADDGKSYTITPDDIEMVDEISTIVIDKKAVGGGEIPVAAGNAKFELTGSNLSSDIVTVSGATVDSQTAGKIEFTGNDATIKGLKDGDYTLKETAGPEGYECITEFNFTIENGVITKSNAADVTNGSVAVDEEGKTVTVSDKLKSSIVITKADVDGNKIDDTENSAKATFELSGSDLTGVTAGGVKAANGATSITFTGNESTIIGLKDGVEYTLEETVAPDGYVKISSSFTFKLKDGKVDEGSITGVTDGEVEVSEDGKIIVKDKKSSITVSKRDLNAATDTKVSATFKLSAETSGVTLDGVTAGTATAGTDGTITFTGSDTKITGLKDGTYKLSEIAADGNYVTVSEFTFVIEAGKLKAQTTISKTNGDVEFDAATGTITVKDARKIEISKKELGADNESVDLADDATDAEFVLSGSDLTGVTAGGVKAADGATSITFTGNEATIIGLKDGTYTLHEETAPNGYLTVSDFTFTIKDGKVDTTNTVNVTDGAVKLEEGKIIVMDEKKFITVSKRDFANAETALEAKFELSVAAVAGNTASLDGVTAGGVKAADGATSITFTGSDTKITGLKDGTYNLHETTAPTGYVTISDFTFVIANGIVTEVSAVTNGDVTKSADGKTITVLDQKKISISKKGIASDGTEVEFTDDATDATFELTIESGVDNFDDVTVGDTKYDETTEKITFTDNDADIVGLKDGTYKLKETVAPDGYTVVTEFEFVIENGTVKSVTSETDGEVSKSDDGTTIIIKDNISKIQIDKKDVTGKNEVAGATLTLTGGPATIDWTEIVAQNTGLTAITNGVQWTSAAGGQIIYGLPDGEYTLAETAADATNNTFTDANGVVYKVTDSTVTFEIVNGEIKADTITTDEAKTAADSTATDSYYIYNSETNQNLITVANAEKLTTVKISKVEINESEEIGDAHLQILDKDGNVVKEWDSVAGEQKEFELPAGEYTLKETIAPEGYVLADEIDFTVKGGKVYRGETEQSGNIVKMEDDYTKLTIFKKNSEGLLDGAKMALYKASDCDAETLQPNEGATAITTWNTTDVNPRIFVKLALGSYVIVELDAPEGYKIAAPKLITLEDPKVTEG